MDYAVAFEQTYVDMEGVEAWMLKYGEGLDGAYV